MLALIVPYSCNLISIDRLLMEMDSNGCLFHQARSATKIILWTGSWAHSLLKMWGSKRGWVRNWKQRDLLSNSEQSSPRYLKQDKFGGSGLVWASLPLKSTFTGGRSIFQMGRWMCRQSHSSGHRRGEAQLSISGSLAAQHRDPGGRV